MPAPVPTGGSRVAPWSDHVITDDHERDQIMTINAHDVDVDLQVKSGQNQPLKLPFE
jgi:hypothetical protein